MDTAVHNTNGSWYYNQRCNMTDPDNMRGCLYSLTGIILIIILSLLLSSCKTQYVPVETTKTEYKTNTVHDSIYLEVIKHDSTIVEKQGDTVFITKYQYLYKDRWKERLATDTLIRRDTVYVPYPVERQLTKWQQFKLNFADVGFGVCALLVMQVCGYLFVRKRT